MTQVVRAHTLGSRHSKGSRHEYRERIESNQYHGGSEDGYVTFFLMYRKSPIRSREAYIW